MKIGILGSGDVGKALAKGFISSGFEVMIGTRHQDKLKSFVLDNEKIQIGSFTETSQFGEIIVIATLWTGTKDAIELAGIDNFNNKIVLDITNPLDFSQGMPPKLLVGGNTSAGEIIQDLLPHSYVVKTLNIIGNTMMINPKLEEGIPDMFICGNNDNAKEKVISILKNFGWEKITDLGNIEESRIMEPLCILWVTYGIKNNSWTHAISILRK